jgi:hypothetical protein
MRLDAAFLTFSLFTPSGSILSYPEILNFGQDWHGNLILWQTQDLSIPVTKRSPVRGTKSFATSHRDEEEQNGQPDQGLLPWWSWTFHLAAHLPMCVGQESINECLAKMNKEVKSSHDQMSISRKIINSTQLNNSKSKP